VGPPWQHPTKGDRDVHTQLQCSWRMTGGEVAPTRSEQQGDTHTPGDTAEGRGVCNTLPTSAAFGLMPLVQRRTKPGDQETKPADPTLCSALAAEQPAACVTSQTSMVDGSNYRAAHS